MVGGTPHGGSGEVASGLSVPGAQVAERRVCSVMFADLVGFTPFSESRDPEEVRELLSVYFDRAKTIIDRYGGVVEKFIGDAVMAVWGTPVATEGDAERAVRAALDVVAAVEQLGEELGAPGLAARAGVVTGEVAVTVGLGGEGVAGDAVNTAARVQSVAGAGSVWVRAPTLPARSTLPSPPCDRDPAHTISPTACSITPSTSPRSRTRWGRCHSSSKHARSVRGCAASRCSTASNGPLYGSAKIEASTP